MDSKSKSRHLHFIIWISAFISASLIYLKVDRDSTHKKFQGMTRIEPRLDVDILIAQSKKTNHGPLMKIQDSITKVGQEERGFCSQEQSLPLPTENTDVSRFAKCVKVNYSDRRLNKDILHRLSDPNYLTRQSEYTKHNAKAPEIQHETFEKMGIFVQRTLSDLQNPRNCSSVSKVKCSLTRNGFGSALHHAVFCLMYAYATNRSLLLNTDTNRYGNGTWEKFLRPVSENCSCDPEHIGQVGRGTEVVSVGMPRPSAKFPLFCPPAMPPEILEMGKGLDFDIMAWWTGQILSFAFRLVPELDAQVKKMAVKIGFKSPIVGIHIRRTDKVGNEASKFSVEEYMEYAERFYDKLASVSRVTSRKIYLATDEPRVLVEARSKYPAYTIIGDRDIALSANPKHRSNEDGLKGIIIDLYFLSLSDYLICTFSSNVCRAAYELRQSRLLNASRSTISLDCHHFFFTIFQLPRIALCPHIPNSQEEIVFAAGDLIYSYGTLNNGYSVGRNLNSTSSSLGIYPSYKVKTVLVPYRVPVV